jgi:hypothetical protein
MTRTQAQWFKSTAFKGKSRFLSRLFFAQVTAWAEHLRGFVFQVTAKRVYPFARKSFGV